MVVIANLGASRSFGGPERQVLDVATHLPAEYRPLMISFSEGGRCGDYLAAVHRAGLEGIVLKNDTPRLWSALDELERVLVSRRVDLLCCHGYKADLLGRIASRRLGLPAIAVAHGWTHESMKVRVYESLDRRVMRLMDHVACVSACEAARVRSAGVPLRKISVIRNAIRIDRFAERDSRGRERLERMFRRPVKRIVGVAGRLSPEKGFDVLIRAARRLATTHPEIGIVWFGDGPSRSQAASEIELQNLGATVVLAGFCSELDRLMPYFDLLAMPSYTEGLPGVLLEAFAARVPAVATSVGGIPEVLEDGRSGYMVAAGDWSGMASRIVDALDCENRRLAMGDYGRKRVEREFTCQRQAAEYSQLFRAVKQMHNQSARPRSKSQQPVSL